MRERTNLSDENGLYREKAKYPNKKLHIVLPIPPSVNHMYYNTKNGGKHLTRVAENYIRQAKALINEAIEEQKFKIQHGSVWYNLDLIFFMPDRRRRDSHNTLKILLDTLEGSVYDDDYYVMPRIQGVEYDKNNPRVVLHLSPQSTNDRIKGLKIAKVSYA